MIRRNGLAATRDGARSSAERQVTNNWAGSTFGSRVADLIAHVWYGLIWCPCWAISQVWFNYRYDGRSHVPTTGPVLLVANHQSHLDPVLVGLACPRQLKFLARHDLFFWPFSWWIRALGAVPIDRQRGTLGGIKTTLKQLQQGEAVLVFPEGTRTRDGSLTPLLPGFCLLARRSGATIVPVAIVGAFDSMPRGRTFPAAKPIRLSFAAPVMFKQAAELSDQQLVALVDRRIRDAMRPEFDNLVKRTTANSLSRRQPSE